MSHELYGAQLARNVEISEKLRISSLEKFTSQSLTDQ